MLDYSCWPSLSLSPPSLSLTPPLSLSLSLSLSCPCLQCILGLQRRMLEQQYLFQKEQRSLRDHTLALTGRLSKVEKLMHLLDAALGVGCAASRQGC